jgi:hypothetical protein
MILVVWNGKDHYQRVPSEWSHLPGPHPGKRKHPLAVASDRQGRSYTTRIPRCSALVKGDRCQGTAASWLGLNVQYGALH